MYQHPHALVALLFAHYTSGDTLTVYRLEEQCRAIMGISPGNTKAIRRLRQDLSLLEEKGLIRHNMGLNGRQTLLIRPDGGKVLKIHPETLQLIFESGWSDLKGLVLCAYFFISKLRMGVVDEATLYHAQRQISMSYGRLHRNVSELVRLDIFRRTAYYGQKGQVKRYILCEVIRRDNYKKAPSKEVVSMPGQGCTYDQWQALYEHISRKYWLDRSIEFGNDEPETNKCFRENYKEYQEDEKC